MPSGPTAQAVSLSRAGAEGRERVRGRPFDRSRRALGAGGAALLDQGIFSGTNVALHFVLARWLSPTGYGAYAVGLSALYLVGALHTAVLTEPVLVFAPGRFRSQDRAYLGFALWVHLGASVFLAAAAAAVAGYFFYAGGSGSMARVALAMAAAAPCSLLYWLVRRFPYAAARPAAAAAGSAVRLSVVAAAVAALHVSGRLSAATAILAEGAASAVASLAVLPSARPDLRPRAVGALAPAALRAHADYGTWNGVGAGVFWVATQGILLLLPVRLGLAAAGAVAAAWNLFRPVGLLVQSISLVLLPTFARWYGGYPGRDAAGRRVWIVAGVLSAATAAYGLAVTLLAPHLYGLLYGPKYRGHEFVAGFFLACTTGSVLVSVLSAAMKAQGRVRRTAWIWTASAILVAIFGRWAVDAGGLAGGMGLYTAGYAVAAATAAILFARGRRAPETEGRS